MRHTLAIAGLALSGAVVLATPASATVTFVQASLGAFAGAVPTSDKSDTVTASSLPTSPLTESLSNFTGVSSGNVTASASFTSEVSGSLNLDSLKAYAHGLGEPGIGQTGSGTASATLIYSFTIDSSYLVSIAYDLTADPGADLHYYVEPTGSSSLSNLHDLSGQGSTLSEAFGPGAYTLHIFGGVNALSYPGDPAKNVSASGEIDFLLLPNGRPGTGGGVPEPASWALMIAGFGGVGAAMRRRAVKNFAGV